MKWDLKRGESFLLGVSLGKLRSMYASEKDGKVKLRLLCAVKRKEGGSIDKIATVLCLPRSTVRAWIRRFQERGLAGKEDQKKPGKKPKLSLEQRKDLVECLVKGPPYNPGGLWSTKEVVDLIRKRCGVSLSNSRVWVILQELGFTVQKPRKRHYKAASKDEQKAFKKRPKE